MAHSPRFNLHCRNILAVTMLLALLAGCSGSGTGGGDETPVQTSSAKFASCNDLKTYLLETTAADQQLHTGYAPGAAEMNNAMELAQAANDGTASSRETAVDYTKTNVQEEGVDEPDFVKTDGRYIYMISGDYFLIMTSWPAAQMAETSRLELEGYPQSFFLSGDRALVFSHVYPDNTLLGSQTGAAGFMPKTHDVLKATLIDVSDRTAPAVLKEVYFEGSLTDARMVGDKAHAVVHTSIFATVYPYIYSTGPAEPGSATGTSSSEAGAAGVADIAAEVAAALKQTASSSSDVPITDIFPAYYELNYDASGTASSSAGAICACDDVYRPAEPNGTDVNTLLTIDLNDAAADVKSVSVLGYSGLVYGSTDNIYIASYDRSYWAWWLEDGQESKTEIFKFSLSDTPAYAASGKVKGWVLNQFSMSEYNGYLRVATTTSSWWNNESPANTVYVLGQNGEELQETGEIGGLGKAGELIYAVRFSDDRGYVVTFAQTDPLYTLDLSDPTNPLKVGELEVPGFSTYIQVIDNRTIMAIGQNTTERGIDLSIFDVSDFANPTLVARETVGSGSYSEAQYNHKAFTYFPTLKMLSIPVTMWSYNGITADAFNGLYVYDVDAASGFTLRGTVDHTDLYKESNTGVWYYPEGIHRSIFAGEQDSGYFLYSIGERGVRATDVDDLATPVATVELPAPKYYWNDYVYVLPAGLI